MTHKPSQPYSPQRLALGGAETEDERAMAALLAELPSATPHDLAVERVWRRVAAPPAVRPRWSRFAWVPAMAAVAVLLAIVLRHPPLNAEVALSSGGVFSGKLAEKWRASRAGEPLAEAERVRTDATGVAVLRIQGIASVLVREGSDVGLERMHHGAVLRLSRGVVTARVSKRAPDEPFIIETDRYSVKVVGTLFTVEQGPGDHTAVSVREGAVDVSDGMGRVDRVLAGQRWVSESVGTRSPDRTVDSVKTLLDEGLAGRPAAELAGPFAVVIATSSPPVAPAVAPTPAAPAEGAHPTGPFGDSKGESPVLSTRDTPPSSNPSKEWATEGTPWHAARPARAVAPEAVVPPAALQPAGVESAGATPAPPPSAAVAVTPTPPVDEGPYARGRALEARGEFASAAREFARAADEDPAHADLATYALGRLSQRRLHDPAGARAAFVRYRERFPQGALLPEVDFAMLELEVETHSEALALADSSRFLVSHAGSARTDEVRLLRGNLLRDANRCLEALDDYAKVTATPFADHALYSTAYCQRKLGDLAGAATSLKSYLTRYPNGAHRAEAQQALSDE